MDGEWFDIIAALQDELPGMKAEAQAINKKRAEFMAQWRKK